MTLDHPQDSRPDEKASVERFVGPILRTGTAGFGPFKSAAESATAAMAKSESKDDAAKALVRNHVLLAGAQGFVTNVGGLATMPISLPTNVGAALLVQTHLAASIAVVYGLDPRDDEVQTALLLCLLGNGATEVLKKVGIDVGKKATMSAIKRFPVSVVYAVNRKAGFALLAKYGTKRASVTLAKAVPLIGGGIGGGIDAASTRGVGAFSKKFFGPSLAA